MAEEDPVSKPQEQADRIAQLALSHYETLPKGKPQPGAEWTVFAAVVATTNSRSAAWVVSSATGTKCCPIPTAACNASSASLCILRDSHAETLARRGLVRVLAHEIAQQDTAVSDPSQRLLERTAATEGTYQLRPDVSLHLYVSDSPCGDASIYLLASDERDQTAPHRPQQTATQFTGAKVVVSNESNVTVADCGNGEGVAVWKNHHHGTPQQLVREAKEQLVGKVRSKAGRSNLPPTQRSRSMSCSDKLVRWSVLGLQGALLQALFIPEPIRLTSIVIGQDARAAAAAAMEDSSNSKTCTSCQLLAAGRIAERVVAVQQYLQQQQCQGDDDATLQSCVATFASQIVPPAIHTTHHTFAAGKSVMVKPTASSGISDVGKKRKRSDRGVSPAGLSINWQCNDDDVEVTVGARGIRHGRKPRVAADYISQRSRLSRHALLQLLPDACATTAAAYTAMKRRQPKDQNQHRLTYETVRGMILQGGGPLAGWLIGDATAEATSVPEPSNDDVPVST